MRRRLLYLLMRAYPRGFRRAHGREMAQIFDLQRGESVYLGTLGAVRYWIDVVVDVLAGASRQRFRAAVGPLDPARGRQRAGTYIGAMTLHLSSEKNTMDNILQDLRYALRGLATSPGWTMAVVATLALGLGSTIAIFSLVNDIVLRPLPYQDPDQIQVVEGKNALKGTVYTHASFPTWKIYRDAQAALESLEAWGNLTMTFNFDSGAESLRGAIGTAGLFSALGISPLLGRDFVAGDDLPESGAVVILSHGLWQRRFAGDPGVLGDTFYLEEEPYTIVGIMPSHFRFPDNRAQFWLPMRIAPRAETTTYLRMLGRLQQDLTAEQARTRLTSLVFDVPTGSPNETHRTSVVLHSLHERMVGNVRPMLLIFLGAVAAVLLIACLNVVNLMLSRALGREREVALRTALGAGSLRIVRQFVAESLLLTGLGGACGFLLAGGLLRGFTVLSTSSMPRSEEIGLDAGALAFALILILLVGVTNAMMPAWRSARPNLRASLQEGARGSAGNPRHHRLRHGMIVAQLAITLVLLVGGSLLLKSFASLIDWESGFDPENLLVIEVELPGDRYAEFAQRQAFFDQVIPRLESLPGARAASVTSSHPFTVNSRERLVPEGFALGKEEKIVTASIYVGPDFFNALGMTLLAGRTFDDRDLGESVIINHTVASRYFPSGDAVGRRLRLGSREPHWREVVGVVADMRQHSLGHDPRDMVYLPYSTGQYPQASTILLRTDLDPLRQASVARQAVAEIDQNVPIASMTSLEDDSWASLAAPRLRTILLGIFGLSALLLSMVGLYGVIAYWVAQRSREFGVRMALGADGSRILRQVVGRGLALALLGLALGLFAAPLAVRVIERYLFEVEALDPMSFAVAFLGLMISALLACFVPALRASRLDPVSALRSE